MKLDTKQQTIDETGNRYGKLTVLGRSKNFMHRGAYWKCLCDCGNTTSVNGWKLRNGHVKSCGCYAKERREKSIEEGTGRKRKQRYVDAVDDRIKARKQELFSKILSD